jgi:hypothetical protein
MLSSDVRTVSICARALELLPCMTSSEDAALTARSGVLVAHAAKVNMHRTAAAFFKEKLRSVVLRRHRIRRAGTCCRALPEEWSGMGYRPMRAAGGTERLYCTIAAMTVFCEADARDADRKTAPAGDSPGAVLEPMRREARCAQEPAISDETRISHSRTARWRRGDHCDAAARAGTVVGRSFFASSTPRTSARAAPHGQRVIVSSWTGSNPRPPACREEG